jgi:hypothetical protein
VYGSYILLLKLGGLVDAGVAMEGFLLGDSSGISGVPLALELFEVTLEMALSTIFVKAVSIDILPILRFL